MVVENVEALLHKGPQHRLLGKPGSDDLGQMIMGRLQTGQTAMLPDHDMAIAGAGVELELPAVEVLPDGVHQNIGIGGGDLSGAVVQNGLFRIGLLLGQGHQIAAEHHIVRLHLYAHAERLQRRPAGKVRQRIIAHNGQVGHLASGRHSRGNILNHPHFPLGCQLIHDRGPGKFQRGLSAKGGNGLIGHAVAQNHNVFHKVFLSARCARPQQTEAAEDFISL